LKFGEINLKKIKETRRT